MSHWAKAPLDRNQVALFAPTLDDNIPADHPVRLFHEVLGEIDFADFEARYVRVVGQPPIHPRVMAAEKDRAEDQLYGEIAADSGFNSGPNLTGLEKQGIEPLSEAGRAQYKRRAWSAEAEVADELPAVPPARLGEDGPGTPLGGDGVQPAKSDGLQNGDGRKGGNVREKGASARRGGLKPRTSTRPNGDPRASASTTENP